MAVDPPPSATASLEIDLGAIVANWRLLSARHGAPTAAVMKADAYGTGADQIAPALHAAGCRHAFVAHPGEAFPLRPRFPGMLAVLNGLWPGAMPDLAAQHIRPVLGTLGEIEAWAAHAQSLGRPLPALLHVDTGMNRLGLSPAELAVLQAEPDRLDGITLDYILTHLACADDPAHPDNDLQRHRFAQACARLPPAPRSLANSSAIFLGSAFTSHLARPGAGLYGINPTPGQPNPMQPTIRLRARILSVRDVPVGETVGYNATWTASRASRIATLSVGYADGYLRSLGNQGQARFDGHPVPLVGRVSMDLTTFDVTDLPQAVPGAWLDLIGPGLPVDDVAANAGTNAYEIMTGLGHRYTRTYTTA